MVNPDNYKTVENKIMLLFKLFNSLAGIKRSVKLDNKNIISPLTLFFLLINLFSWIPIVHTEGAKKRFRVREFSAHLKKKCKTIPTPTGQLTFQQIFKNGEDNIYGLDNAKSVAVSVDDQSFYVAFRDIQTAGFERDKDTGSFHIHRGKKYV